MTTKLPPLPEPASGIDGPDGPWPLYTAADMQDYARATVELNAVDLVRALFLDAAMRAADTDEEYEQAEAAFVAYLTGRTIVPADSKDAQDAARLMELATANPNAYAEDLLACIRDERAADALTKETK